MALPHLVKYIYNNGTDEVIRRGKKIYSSGFVELIDLDQVFNHASFRVKDDSYSTFYKVHVNKFNDAASISLRCGCPYNLGEICRHEAAVLFQLQEMMDRNVLNDDSDDYYHQSHTVIKMKHLDVKVIRMLSSREAFDEAQEFLRAANARIETAANERVAAIVTMNDVDFKVIIQKNEERNFDTSCTCDSENRHPLCVHKVVLLLQLIHNYGIGYFDTIRNLDKEKNKLLGMYGYSINDDLTGKFEFIYKDGKPFLKVLNADIKKIAAPVSVPPTAEPSASVQPQKATPQKEAYNGLGLVISNNKHQYPYIQFDIVQGELNDERTAFLGKVQRLDIARYVNADKLNDDDKYLLQQIRKLLPGEVSRYLNRNSPFSGIWENIVQQHDEELHADTRHLIIEYIHPRLKKILKHAHENGLTFFLPKGKNFTTASLEKIFASDEWLTPSFSVQRKGQDYLLEATVFVEEKYIPLTENEVSGNLIFLSEGMVYTWNKTEDVLLLEEFNANGQMLIDAASWQQKLRDFILPLAKNYSVDFGDIKKEEVRNSAPEFSVLLKEKNDYLLFEPQFKYVGHTVTDVRGDKIILPQDDALLIVHRNNEAEYEWMSQLANLHSGFKRLDDGALVLKGNDVLQNNWFFLFLDKMRELQIPVLGFEALKNFKFNTAKPKTQIYISSDTDWFDAKVNIHFGDQKVTVADIKNAIANKQQFVQLGDGTLGILPEEWLKRYSLLFKVGEGKTSAIRLNKYQFSIIEQLYEERNEEELFFQLEEKYERLREMHGIPQIQPPQALQPVLRPYQVSGFQWLNFLHEVGWGGILADDMGLGKTLQALSFLQHLKATSGSLRALVVCPTSLMYNWENEIKKFVPDIKHCIHHGTLRERKNLHLNDADVIITTYGTLRSDIKNFVSMRFDYVVLDESQAIKNPTSKITKAACLLQSKSRLCLSGTPLQNNTFDIFAQMNFLNPGMLGNMEFFRQEFAIPIDKFGDTEQKSHLRRLLFPFLLRRTKEQVAKDLPEKTETILFCEMGAEQRKIYDAYRNDYRDKILGVVDAQGVQRSQLTILQGLMKLRQICDSPAILKEDEQFPNVSVKLDELSREITENISDHKALIFSQFLGMLALIKQKLIELEVPFEYFDGSTPAAERERAVKRFQTDDSCRVFLISLKAGGVGLNLTAADYVYIADPWWNPAVEQQAIDRTHRIGQTKNIFAYRMICRNTIEDKILTLQEKKRALAADLITDEAGFVKSLSREDIEYLFS